MGRRLKSTSAALALLGIASVGSGAGSWQPLKNDSLHDPQNPAIEVLQEPSEALGVLVPDSAGNKVDWVRSLQQGLIQPRASLRDDREPVILDTTILMKNTLDMPYVLFPHKPHSQWMACETCHESIFISQVDANPINMGKILNGEYCGLCHGAVSFPLTECNRCHNTDPATVANGTPAGGAATQ
jgi:c(7)-type cytochrome triheme protein